MKNQKIISAVLLTTIWLSLFAFLHTVEAGVLKSDKPYKVEKFNTSPGGSLYVQTSGGSIQATGHNSNETIVEVYVRSSKWSGEKLIEMLKENYSITIKKSGNRVEAIAKRTGSSWSNGGISISFVVMVPKRTDCEMKTSGGSLKLKDIEGKLQSLHTSGGSISLNNVHSDVELRTSGGSIRVEDYVGNLDGRTSGGSIKVTNAEGEIDVVTSGGGIKLDGLSGDVSASTSGGSISANFSSLTGPLDLKTSGGNVRATVPAGLGLDLDLRGSRVETKLVNFTGEAKRDRISGKVNGGGIPVRMVTSGGSVILQFE